jgi:hypothetical protein
MTKHDWFSRLINKRSDSKRSESQRFYLQPSFSSRPIAAGAWRIAAGVGAALLLAGAAAAQNAAMAAQGPDTAMSVPNGYSIHEVVDLGGRLNDVVGSGAMYDSLLNQHTGPRVFNETFEMHALPGKKGTPLDDLTAFGSG